MDVRGRITQPAGHLATGVVLDVDEHATRALLDESFGDGRADPARRAGDDGDLTVEHACRS